MMLKSQFSHNLMMLLSEFSQTTLKSVIRGNLSDHLTGLQFCLNSLPVSQAEGQASLIHTHTHTHTHIVFRKYEDTDMK